MEMIPHQAISQQSEARIPTNSIQRFEKRGPVLIISKDGAPIHSARQRVINGT